MEASRSAAGPGTMLLLALSIGATAALAPAQDQAAPRKSVYGKLHTVDKGQNAVVMTSDDGERLAWRFEPRVIERIAELEPGQEMIVIYRPTRPNEKAVTAIAFPGTASVPTYLNETGARVVLRSGPRVDGDCGQVASEPPAEVTIADGGLVEIDNACWCCAPDGEACTPGNQTGIGKALLVSCFQ